MSEVYMRIQYMGSTPDEHLYTFYINSIFTISLKYQSIFFYLCAYLFIYHMTNKKDYVGIRVVVPHSID